MAKRKKSNEIDSLALLTQLMAIPGTSGDESKVSEFICDQLRKAGLPDSAIQFDNAHKKSPLRGKIGNLIVKIPGNMRSPRRMLCSHMDTVPVCIGSEPKRKGDLIVSANPATGLGADNRAGVATVLLAALKILQEDLRRPPLTLLFTIQEEIGLKGAQFLSVGKLGNPKLVFNWDGGSSSKLTIGATGGYRMSITVLGKASHAGGAPEKGVSAIAIASLAIADLHTSGWHGDIHQSGKHGTSNIGIIAGGNATNVVADSVCINAEARSHNAAFRKKIIQRIESSFKNAAKKVKSADRDVGQVQFEGRLDYESFCLSKEEPCVVAAEAAVRKLGSKAELAVANGGLDANWLSARGFPTVSLGCGQLNQHMTSEALNISEFRNACEIALTLATASENV